MFKKKVFILIVLLMFTSALFLSALQPVLAETNQKLSTME